MTFIHYFVLIGALAAAAFLPAGARGDERAAPGAPAPIRVYVGTYTGGESRGIYVCELDGATGQLTAPVLAGEAKNPSFLAIHPSGRWLYAASEVDDYAETQGGAVAAFAIDPQDGRLELVNTQSSMGAGPCHVVVDEQGRHVLVANYGAGSVAALPIGEDGRLEPASSVVQHQGSSVNRERQSGPHAHSINLDPANRYAIVADLGLDQVLSYRFDGAAGTLAPNEAGAAEMSPGAGPRHVAFHPNGRLAFVINELASTMTSLRYDAARGALEPIATVSTLPADAKVANSTADIHVHPSGKFVYGSNRGHDSIAMFAVDAESGGLTPLGNHPTGGRTPRNFGIEPTGTFLLAANQDSGTITVHRIDAATGLLEATAHVAHVPMPVCVQFLSPAR